MKKDKITIAYIFVAIIAFALIIMFYAKLDLDSMNENIEKGVQSSYKGVSNYSDKLYTMVSSEWNEQFSSSNITKSSDVKKPDNALSKKVFSFKTRKKGSEKEKIDSIVNVSKLESNVSKAESNTTVSQVQKLNIGITK